MTALVTGAGGFIGRHMLRQGDRAMFRNCRDGGNESAVRADLLDPASLFRACEGVDTVFHCAGYVHAFQSSDPSTHWRVNLEGTKNILKAAGACGVRRFVFFSTVKAMAEPGDDCVDEEWPGEPVSEYGRAKRAAEGAVLEAAERCGIHAVNLRLAMVYGRGGRGNLERMAQAIRRGRFPPLPETHNRRSLVHVDDVVAAARLVAEHPAAAAQTFIVSGARPYSGREIYDEIRRALNLSAITWAVSPGLLRGAGHVGTSLQRIARRPLPINTEVVDRLLGSACFSAARIERVLGWRAKVDLATGLREMLSDEAPI